MGLINKIKKGLNRGITVEKVRDGHDSIPQQNLPGEETLVIDNSKLIGPSQTIYLPIRDDKVALPKMWKNKENGNIAHLSSIIHKQTKYSVTYEPFFKDDDGRFMATQG